MPGHPAFIQSRIKQLRTRASGGKSSLSRQLLLLLLLLHGLGWFFGFIFNLLTRLCENSGESTHSFSQLKYSIMKRGAN